MFALLTARLESFTLSALKKKKIGRDLVGTFDTWAPRIQVK
jgi:hypothetical protein